MRQTEPFQAALDRRLEVARSKVTVTHLGGQENLVARNAGFSNPLSNLGLVVVEDGGVDMTVAHLEGRADCLDTDVALQRHGSEPDGRNPRTPHFDHWNHSTHPHYRWRGECRARQPVPSMATRRPG